MIIYKDLNLYIKMFVVYSGDLSNSLNLNKLRALSIEFSFNSAKEFADNHVVSTKMLVKKNNDWNYGDETCLLYKNEAIGIWVVNVAKNTLLATYHPEQRKMIYLVYTAKNIDDRISVVSRIPSNPVQQILLGICDTFKEALNVIFQSTQETIVLASKENIYTNHSVVLKLGKNVYWIERKT
jgi:hypothetical protein